MRGRRAKKKVADPDKYLSAAREHLARARDLMNVRPSSQPSEVDEIQRAIREEEAALGAR